MEAIFLAASWHSSIGSDRSKAWFRISCTVADGFAEPKRRRLKRMSIASILYPSRSGMVFARSPNGFHSDNTRDTCSIFSSHRDVDFSSMNESKLPGPLGSEATGRTKWASFAWQHRLYFLPLPQGHGEFLPIFVMTLSRLLVAPTSIRK